MEDQQDPTGSHEQEALGSLAEEALKFAGAFTQWAGAHGADLGKHAHEMGEQAREAWRDLDDHLATGSAECTVCPFCRTLSAVREVAPEVKEHLGAAAGSLLGAAAGLLSVWSSLRADGSAPASDGADPAPGHDTATSPDRASRVQDISLDDEPDPQA